MAAFNDGMAEEVCVMLVGNDKEFVVRTANLLKSYDYKVMMIDTISTSMIMLSKGKQKIDVMILNVHSANQLSFDLLAQAVSLNIISIVICDESDALAAKRALDEGAYLFLRKPFNEEIMKNLWQFVLQEKIQRERVRKGSEKNRGWMNVNGIGNNIIVGVNEQSEKKKSVFNTDEIDDVSDEKYNLSKKRGRFEKKEINEEEGQKYVIDRVIRQKNHIEWTDRLHAKFMEAVERLGEGRCYPKQIVEMMNVSGLTRMQVASHLQKCRRNNWRSPKERKSTHYPSDQEFTSDSLGGSFRKFGTMPDLQMNAPKIQRGLDFPFSTLSTNNIFGRGESIIQRQLFHPQHQIQPHFLSNGNLFNNPLYPIPSNIGGGLQQQQQQHQPLFGLLSSQRPQGSIIGSTSTYRLGQALNNGDHRTQSGYNLNFNNVAQGATYSGNRIMPGAPDIENFYNLNINSNNVTIYSSNAMMSDAYVGNAAINQLEAANANFQQYLCEPNMSNVVAASREHDIEESWSSERKPT